MQNSSLPAFFRMGMQRRFVSVMLASAFVLGAIQREVGVAHQRFHGCAVAGADRRAYAGSHVKSVVVHFVRL